MILFAEQKQRINVWTLTGGKESGINWEIEIDIYTLLSIGYITNKNLLNSTGNSIQYSVMTYMGKESKKEWVYVCITDLLCCTEKTNTTL